MRRKATGEFLNIKGDLPAKENLNNVTPKLVNITGAVMLIPPGISGAYQLCYGKKHGNKKSQMAGGRERPTEVHHKKIMDGIFSARRSPHPGGDAENGFGMQRWGNWQKDRYSAVPGIPTTGG